jgi:hypothetical protein
LSECDNGGKTKNTDASFITKECCGLKMSTRKEFYLLGYNIMSGESPPMFWRNMLPPPSGAKGESNKKPA